MAPSVGAPMVAPTFMPVGTVPAVGMLLPADVARTLLLKDGAESRSPPKMRVPPDRWLAVFASADMLGPETKSVRPVSEVLPICDAAPSNWDLLRSNCPETLMPPRDSPAACSPKELLVI